MTSLDSIPSSGLPPEKRKQSLTNGISSLLHNDLPVKEYKSDHLARYAKRLQQRHHEVEVEEETRYQALKQSMHAKYLARLEKRIAVRHALKKRAQLEEERRRAIQLQNGQATNQFNVHHPSYADTHMLTEEQLSMAQCQSPEDEFELQRQHIWRVICHSQIPKAHRLMVQSTAMRQSNCKKLVIACHREARRSVTRARLTRDLPVRARRSMREMLLFWKRNEKEEREQRRKAEKAALEKLRQEEEEREAKRQARKLNFLITQTELYSHFIGSKVTAGRDDDDDDAKQEDIAPAMHKLDVSSTGVEDTSMELDIEGHDGSMGEIDFDNDDDATIQARARLNAQAALEKQAAQTRQFDAVARGKRGDHDATAAAASSSTGPIDFDEMDFLNPSGMSTATEIQQPKMLNCELKKYQLKGLQWLANLYDQGINGILADEMGLGKTVQSISLMAHLAENHSLWGPFLVVAPAVTLHNWHQEISRFVPDFKVLPYWGTVNERKVLRKAWSKLYTKDAPFHVLITSYQIVVADQGYFQKIKWQYMILDEAQAIKSSSSTRWKTLLKFNTRNRTPIQNNMQELWALLHFIMPTLFDSHDEFSDWFAKDIESHAENKGTLNERKSIGTLTYDIETIMLRRIKKHVQHELGDKEVLEKISLAELLRKVESSSSNGNGGDSDSVDSLMNLVMQFRVQSSELFERAEATFPFSCSYFGMAASLTREGDSLEYQYSTRGMTSIHLPKLIYRDDMDTKKTSSEVTRIFHGNMLDRYCINAEREEKTKQFEQHELLETTSPLLKELMSISTDTALDKLSCVIGCYYPRVVSAPCELVSNIELNMDLAAAIRSRTGTSDYIHCKEATITMDATPLMQELSTIHVPPLARLVQDSGKLQRLDRLLAELKAGGHRVLIYFQMTRMIDLMEEYLAYRRYTYLRLDGSSKIEDRRDMVSDWQTKDDIFIFLLSTRAGGLGINLTAADTVVFYDSDWNPTVDQQAMDRAHRLGQTRQVTVYRLITAGTIEERILNRAKQKDEIQKVVIAGGDFRPVEFKSREIVSLLMEDA
ncbi:P-loop containing nucleoside triphosphate hydrolase protein [Syncephalis plumigaleata]|nr:P-loop containing nucleoside triphosphate hydrolase protein [Syncephalis plumigaleata]